ncbi:MAG: hypothetical protein ACK5L0_05720 [Candidatus Fimivivens sp.]
MTTYIIVVLCCAIVVMLYTLGRAKAMQMLLPSAFSGMCGLLTVHLSSLWGTALLTLNAFTIAVALFFGIPGVVGLLFMRLVCVI